MAKCKVTALGISAEIEAESLYRAVLAYDTFGKCCFPSYGELARLEWETSVEVEVNGKTYITTLRKAMDWANAKPARDRAAAREK